jgi:hypothetical protein
MARGLLRSAGALGAFVAVALVATSCSLAFDLGREQCAGDGDCAALGADGAKCVDNVCVVGSSGTGGDGGGGGGVDPAWACLGSFETPTATTIAHKFRFEYATAAGVPPPDLAIELCSSLDVDCANPVPGIPQPDSTGTVTLELAPTFTGFLKITSSDMLMPSVAYLQSPVILPPNENVIRLIRPTEFAALVTASKQTYDDTRGVAVILTDNCLDARSAGVVITTTDTDPDTVAFYFRGNLPDVEAASTDEQGAAGFLNLPLGIVTVDGFVGADGPFIGEASFEARAGTISYVTVGPTPAP